MKRNRDPRIACAHSVEGSSSWQAAGRSFPTIPGPTPWRHCMRIRHSIRVFASQVRDGVILSTPGRRPAVPGRTDGLVLASHRRLDTADRIDRWLTLTALLQALRERRPQPGLNHHTDQGGQYAAYESQEHLLPVRAQRDRGTRLRFPNERSGCRAVRIALPARRALGRTAADPEGLDPTELACCAAL